MYVYNDASGNAIPWNGVGRLLGNLTSAPAKGDLITFTWLDTTGTPQSKTVDGNDLIKKAAKDKLISADEEKRALEEMQKLTDEEIKRMEEMSKKKEVEVMQV